MDVPRLLRQARREADLGQRELAEKAGLSPSMLSRYERGHRLPTLAVLDRLLAACDRDVRLVLVRRQADVHDELARRAQLSWEERCGPRLAPLLARLVAHDCRVVVAGAWAVLLHGLPADDADGVLLVPRDRVDQVAAALNLTGAPHRQLDGATWTAGYATQRQFGPSVEVRWAVGDSGPFVTRVVEDGEPWPATVQVDTDAGPLRVLAAEALTPADGVRDEVLALRRGAAT